METLPELPKTVHEIVQQGSGGAANMKPNLSGTQDEISIFLS